MDARDPRDPSELCASFLAGRPLPSCPLPALLQSALADPEFVRDVSPVLGADWLAAAARCLAGRLSSTSLSFREGIVPLCADVHPLLATMLWFAPPACPLPPLWFSGAIEPRSIRLLLLAGRRSLRQMTFDRGACFLPEIARPAFAPLARCELLEAVRVRSIPPQCQDHITSALAQYAPPSLVSLSLEFFAAHQIDTYRWKGGLPRSLLHLSLTNAGRIFGQTGLAAAIAEHCPGLTSLSVDLYSPHADDASDDTDSAALAQLISRLPGLHSLNLGTVTLTDPLVAALASLPDLRCLCLRGAFVRSWADGDLLARALRNLRSLTLSDFFDVDTGALNRFLLLGLSQARHLDTLHLTMQSCYPDVRQLASTIALCTSSAPIRDLCVNVGAIDDGSCLALVDAAALARRTLRCFSMSQMGLSERSTWAEIARRLAGCVWLEKLVVRPSPARGSMVCPRRLDEELIALVRDVAAHAPRLEEIRTGNLGTSPTSLADDPLLGSYLPRSQLAARHVAACRRRQTTGPAWGVIMAGVVAQQERRLARGGGAHAAAASSVLCLMPASVLRKVHGFLETTPAPLLVW
jgi:hypothetical protein